MSCHDYRTILEQSTEERTALPANVVEHFQSCSSTECQEIFTEYELINEAISQWKSALPRVDLVAAVVSDLAPLPESSRPQMVGVPTSRSTSRGPSAAAVVAVLATLSLCLILMVGALPKNERPLADVTPPAPSIAEHIDTPVKDENVEAELRELGKTYGSWVQGAANKLTDTMTVVLIDDQSQSSEKTPGWFSNITEQIEPIESKLDETLKMLMEQVSVESDEQTYVSSTVFEIA